MKAPAISALDAIRLRLEEDLGFTEPLRELVEFVEGLEETKKVSQKKIEKLAAMLRDASDAYRPILFAEIRSLYGEQVAAQVSKLVRKPVGRPSRPWMEAKGAEQVACAASGALNLKRGQKGDKKKLAKEILKRTKSKKLARKAMKLAQEY